MQKVVKHKKAQKSMLQPDELYSRTKPDNYIVILRSLFKITITNTLTIPKTKSLTVYCFLTLALML